MKHLYHFLWTSTILLFLHLDAFSQEPNLVINPSFEQPIDFQNSSTVSNWSKCLKNDTPDYIEFSSRGEPDFYYRKYIGGLLPYDGNAYVGLFCFRTNPLRGVENIREFIQVPLKESLQKDTLYKVSLVIAIDPESNTAINNFNIYFSRESVAFKKERQMFELSPQIRFKKSYFDSISWTSLETAYKARGYESHLIIGNFLTDNRIRKKQLNFESDMMKKWNLHELELAAYYYIDMVSVVKYSGKVSIDELEQNNSDKMIELSDCAENIEADTISLEIEKAHNDSSIVLNNIFFDFDKADLLPASYNELDKLYEQLQIFQDLLIIIEGHTDNIGTFEYNMQLSIDRAEAVVNYLLNQGLDENRISYEGFGYTRPLSINRDEAGRQLNRRVAFRVNRRNN